jgi:hypothetical protein
LCFQSEIQKSRLLFGAPVIGTLLFFAGCREAMTPDLKRYKELYESFNSLEASFIEPSFYFFSKFLNWIGLDYHALFVAYSFITLLFIYLGIRNYTEHIKLSLLFYILIPSCFLNMFVEMREVCTVAIVFYATSILRSRDARFRIARTIVFAILSVAFHYSAILYWVILLVSYKFMKRAYPTFVYLALIVGSLLVPASVMVGALRLAIYPFTPAKYRGYIDIFITQETAADPGQLLKSLIYILLASTFVLWRSYTRSKTAPERESDPVLLNLFVIGVLILNLSRSVNEVSRVAYYFLIQQIVIFPLLLDQLNGRVKRLLAAYSIFLFYVGQFAWGLFYYSQEAGSFVFLHYQNAFLSAL